LSSGGPCAPTNTITLPIESLERADCGHRILVPLVDGYVRQQSVL
jgi:hypothetical protein